MKYYRIPLSVKKPLQEMHKKIDLTKWLRHIHYDIIYLYMISQIS